MTTATEVAAGRAAAGLEISGLHKSLGGRTIIDSLDLTVEAGELVSLLGPSGCGKTTTLRMIAGFLTPDAGSIQVGGREVVRLGPERRPSAMVFQNYALWPHMTVAKNVGFPLKLRKLPRKEVADRVDAALALVNLMHHKDSRPARISGGEQQRTALARALVQEPELLLLDEPLSNLDAKLRVKVREDIREIQQRLGITTVVVTHDQEEAMSMSDRIAVMNDGRIEQFSTSVDLYSTPATEFVATFIGSLNRFEGRIEAGRIASGSGVVGIRPEDVRFSADGADDKDGWVPATVERVVPRGHFAELYVKREDAELRAYVTGALPPVGARGHARVEKWLEFEDGKLVRRGSAC
ncbi:putative spermidine/putrescine transport system ATP-binding protein [Kribbella aluminosa]|uniref:Spermidine/putrescine transport system ATP-binding protein n=1 Tax=Kribbella aluminosa TaxID=416017 RepID=A0ABS4ULV7_9ACTN|nr:ABC transporter ATP-binding protein [Kribbella aluminosa]MBP2352556.1 putative spermidine/putrescine transport system ATP-binding protein [Kribbella aluminosa]